MTVSEFVNRYSKIKSADDCMFFIQNRIKRTYVPFAEKNVICQRVIDIQNRHGKSSGIQYIVYFLQLVSSYTDILMQYVDDNGIFIADKEYDRLKEAGLLDLIIGIIPENELAEFNFVMNYTVQDRDTYNDQLLNWSDLLSAAGGQNEKT